MPALYHAEVVKIAAHYNIGAPHDAVNVTYWVSTIAGLTNAQLTAIQSAFDPAWANMWKIQAMNTTSYIGSVVTDMSSATGAQVDNTGFTPVAGSATSGSVLSDGTALLLSYKAPLRYRGGHGRTYLPGVASVVTSNDGRNVQDSTLTALTTAWNSLQTAMAAVSSANGGPLHQILWNQKLSTIPDSLQQITTVVPQKVLATQRRRLRRVSRHRRTP